MITVPFTRKRVSDICFAIFMWTLFLSGILLTGYGIYRTDLNDLGYLGLVIIGIFLIAFPLSNFLGNRLKFKEEPSDQP